MAAVHGMIWVGPGLDRPTRFRLIRPKCPPPPDRQEAAERDRHATSRERCLQEDFTDALRLAYPTSADRDPVWVAARSRGVSPAAGQFQLCGAHTPTSGVTSDLWSEPPTHRGRHDRIRSRQFRLGRTSGPTPTTRSSSLSDRWRGATPSSSTPPASRSGTSPADAAVRSPGFPNGTAGGGSFLKLGLREPEIRDVLDVDAPAGNTNVVADRRRGGGRARRLEHRGQGPSEGIYHDVGRNDQEVYAADLAGRSYAFAAADAGSSTGLRLYDMTSALGPGPTAASRSRPGQHRLRGLQGPHRRRRARRSTSTAPPSAGASTYWPSRPACSSRGSSCGTSPIPSRRSTSAMAAAGS